MSNQYKFDETTGKWLASGAILSGVNSVNGLAGDVTYLPAGIVTTTTGDVSPPVYAKIYTGNAAPATPVTGDIWIDSSYGSGTSNILRWRKIASGGETSLTGVDANSQLLVYTPGYEQLYINGILQYRDSDYVATTGTTITGISALAASDTIEVVAPSATQFGDYYTQAQSDAKYRPTSVVNNSGIYTANAVLGTSYASYISFNITATGRPALVNWSVTYSNGNSGANRTVNARAQMDGITIGYEAQNLYCPLLIGGGTPMTSAHSFIVTPTAGTRNFTLQALASGASSVFLTYGCLTVTEL